MAENPALPIMETVEQPVGTAEGIIKELTFLTGSADQPAVLHVNLAAKGEDGNWDSRVPVVPVRVVDANATTTPDPNDPAKTIEVPEKRLANALIACIMLATVQDNEASQYVLAATGVDVRGLSSLDMGRTLFPHLMPPG